MTEDSKRKVVSCIQKAMGRTGCSSPEEFFLRAERVKAAPRGFDLRAEVKNFQNLKSGGNRDSWHEVPVFIVKHAEEVNKESPTEKLRKYLPPGVLEAHTSSGRVMEVRIAMSR